MAMVRIEVHTSDGTDVQITEESLIRRFGRSPASDVGPLLDEAVRRVRAALGLPAQSYAGVADAAIAYVDAPEESAECEQRYDELGQAVRQYRTVTPLTEQTAGSGQDLPFPEHGERSQQ